MNPDFRKVALIAAALGLVVSLYFALRVDEQAAPAPTTVSTTVTTTPAPAPAEDRAVIEIRIQAGAPAGGIKRETVKRGTNVSIRIVSDTAGELHVHGYDVTSPIEPTGEQELEFMADRAGVFEIELEETHTLLGELTVEP